MAATTTSALGRQVDTIEVSIDFDIIRHFSEHLYGSPNKAVEELVANGFDAFATLTYVYIPGTFVTDRVVVWDNGKSMSQDELHELWWIARSPKRAFGHERVVTHNGTSRAMIGKFGIGKLASYAVGHQITHLCRQADRFLMVSVDYRDVPHLDSPSDSDDRVYRTNIVQLTELEAQDFVKAVFGANTTPEACNALWDTPHWTIAVIDELKDVSLLTHGRLTWILGNGMPLRPDFRVFVNDAEVRPKLGRQGGAWNLGNPKLQQAIRAAWQDALARGNVQGKIDFVDPSATTDGKAAVRLPNLGLVSADVLLTTKSLLGTDPDAPRSYGFFVMVRGRLLNPDDPNLLLPDPSYGTFYRTQFVLHADGLDEDLLADRERLQADTPRTRELAVLQYAIYMAARHEIEARDDLDEQRQRSESLLPVNSPVHFRDPLSSLLLRHGGEDVKPFGLAKPRIERKPLSEYEPVSVLDSDGTLNVNSEHPLHRVLLKRLGTGKPAKDAMQVLDVIAVSELIFEGYLYSIGLGSEQIDKIIQWREGFYRSVAARFEEVSFEEVIREVRESSYQGGKRFEKELVKLFGLMGFSAKHDGASGSKDGLVIAPIGQQEFKFTVEAKGSIGAVENDAAEVASAAAHRDAAGASHALIVAREFKGFQGRASTMPAILKECQATERVSIVTIDALEELLHAVHEFHYPLDQLLPELAIVEPPNKKVQRMQALRTPTEGFAHREVLEAIWERQQGVAAGDAVPYRSIWQEGPNRWGEPTPESFYNRLYGLAQLTDLIRISTEERVVTLLQSPDIIVQQIHAAVERKIQPPPDASVS